MANAQNCTTPTGYTLHLDERHKVFFCQCWAEFKGYDETISLFVHTFKKDMQAAGILDERGDIFDERAFSEWLYERINYYWNHKNATKWQSLARELRQKWLAGMSDLILSHKRPRVEELQKEYYKIPDDYVWKILTTEGGETYIVKRMNTDIKIKTLDQIRKEVEGDTVNVNVNWRDKLKAEGIDPEGLLDELVEQAQSRSDDTEP